MTVDLTPWISKWVPIHYNGGYIVLSYLVSFIGCWTALKLLHRRTGAHGVYNWLFLLGAATAMGAVAVWSMHYIGNRAISLIDGQPDVQIQYSPAFTAGSFFLPICGVGMAFYFFSITERVTPLGTIIGGLLMGSAICGMHYMGQGGITNYEVAYLWPYVLGSAVIAVTASTIALSVFFYFKSEYTNNWYRRGACASMLALAVTGMHYCATRGTMYRLRRITSRGPLSPKNIINAVTVLAITSCLAFIALAILNTRSRQRSIQRARQVVLACVVFDPEGKIMVNPEGLLPCRKITNSFIEKSFDDVFDITHPVFSWIFKASRCWHGVADLIPIIRNHLRVCNAAKAFQEATFTSPGGEVTERLSDFESIFKQLFCVAASDLAATIQEQLINLGVLYDEIMETGTLNQRTNISSLFKQSRTKGSDDLEPGHETYPLVISHGQLLFTVRRASKSESSHLQSSGFGFANPANIIDRLAASMQVPPDSIRSHLQRMENYVSQEHVMEAGVHLACFALRPLLQRGFDILVQKEARNLLPSVRLPIARLESMHINVLAKMDGWTVASCLEGLRGKFLFTSEAERHFVRELHENLIALADSIGDHFFDNARLVSQPFKERRCLSARIEDEATIIAFKIITDVHEVTPVSDNLQFTPLRLFITQQHAYKKTNDIEIFSRHIYREFTGLAEIARQHIHHHSTPRRSSYHGIRSLRGRESLKLTRGRSWNRMRSMSCSVLHDGSSEKNLMYISPSRPLGGLHIEKGFESDVRRGDSIETVELRRLGSISEAGASEVEEESFVEKLVAMTVDERKRQR